MSDIEKPAIKTKEQILDAFPESFRGIEYECESQNSITMSCPVDTKAENSDFEVTEEDLIESLIFWIATCMRYHKWRYEMLEKMLEEKKSGEEFDFRYAIKMLFPIIQGPHWELNKVAGLPHTTKNSGKVVQFLIDKHKALRLEPGPNIPEGFHGCTYTENNQAGVIVGSKPLKITAPGKIKQGDNLKVNGEWQTAIKIIHAGTDAEEIILNLKDNKHFITKMVASGISWAKEVLNYSSKEIIEPGPDCSSTPEDVAETNAHESAESMVEEIKNIIEKQTKDLKNAKNRKEDTVSLILDAYAHAFYLINKVVNRDD